MAVSEDDAETVIPMPDGRVVDLVAEGLDLVRRHVVASVVHGPVGANDADVAVRTRSEVVENPRPDRALDQLHGLGLVHLLPPGRLEDRHRGQASGPHGCVVELGGASVGGDLVDRGPVDVAAPQDQRGADVSLVLEESSFQQGARRNDARLRVGVHAEEL
ncbi:unnamed protein product [Pseudo-nitzschia multistriata]|uniref:Uncharacterized protein n=1 Tax=Pseudo-nitzschia multistriata TaxID=183589 RepID=A0A448ZHC2_9STRA|nr:unnamed protein product [Pseudo-nitzschia multistriata]